MANPWEKYEQKGSSPWGKYQKPVAQEKPKMTAEDASQFARQALETTQYKEAPNTLGATIAGGRRAMENIGQGILQRGSELYDFFTGSDTGQFREELAKTGRVREQQYKPTQEEYPVASVVGEIGGTVAGFPVAPAGKLAAIGAGAAFGAIQPSESGEEMALNIAQDALLGGLGAWAAPYLQKGFNKSQAMFSGLYKKATGADPRPSMFTSSGALSDEGKRAIEEIGITQDEFARIYQNLDQNLDPIQAARVARAKEQGIPLTTAQATKDFAQQESEQTLRSGIGREAEAARQIEGSQQDAIRAAQERFELGIDSTADREVRGAGVQQALIDMEREGRKNVSDMYKAASEIKGTGASIDTESLIDVIDTNIIDRPISDSTLDTVESVMAKFGLLDGQVEKSGRFSSVVDADGKRVKFKGEQTPLSLDNAEELRQKLRAASQGDQSGAVTQMINKLDEVVEQSIEGLPSGSARTDAFQAARQATREQKQIFNSKDIIENLIKYKKGTTERAVNPDRVIDSILKGPNALSNLRKVKSTLMKDPTNKTVDAWKAVQAQGVADLFSQSVNPATGDISGARLNSAIKKFGGGNEKEGVKRLRVLLGDRYAEFDNLVKAIGDATIPVKGVTNPSGTAYKLINFMTRVGNTGSLAGDAVASLAGKAKDSAKSRSVLRRIESADPEKVKQAVRANDELIDSFVRLGITGTLRSETE